jgi:endoglucanase
MGGASSHTGGSGSGGANTGGSVSTGGAVSSGGSSGGSTKTGGSVGTGGAVSSGGSTKTGGSVGTGGAVNTGGASGGSTGNGGASTGGSSVSTGGAVNSGGAIASGGATSKGGSSGSTGGSSGSGDTVNAATMAIDMGFGANIGNTLENTTTWETGWGQPLITQTFINGMASHGIKSVRVPVAWNTYATNGVIDSVKMNRVKEVVGWIEAAGMYSIVNIHWDGGWIDNESNTNKYKLTDDVKTKFASYWTQIATAFSTVGHKLIFEGLNEEGKFYVNGDTSQAPDYTALNQLNQLFVTTVRAQGGYNETRALLIAGFTTDIALTCVDAFTVPTDPAGTGKLFLSIHYYTPYTFCGLDSVESWGSPATTWGTAAEKTTLQDLFTKLATFSSQKKIPVIIGEFSVTRGEKYPRDSASRILWMETVAKTALSDSMVPVLWDTGSEINRTDGSFSTELQSVMTFIK